MTEKFIRRADNPGAVVNADSEALKAYKARKQQAEAGSKRLEMMEQRINSLEQQLAAVLRRFEDGK